MFVLASASPRRVELLKKLVSDFLVIPSSFDEKLSDDLSPEGYAMRCAEGKALDVFKQLRGQALPPDNKCRKSDNNSLPKECKSDNKCGNSDNQALLVLGADTVVVVGGKILGKPTSKGDARSMLRAVCGKEHEVITGICLICGGVKTNAFDRTVLFIDNLSEREIESYIATNSPFDKAGAYGIQDKIIKDKLKYIRGSFDNVVGLPTELLARLLPQGI